MPLPSTRAEVAICGAGMAGIAAAYHLAVRRGVRGVVLIDRGEPLGLTSSRGTEAYRCWWPGPDDAMIRLTSRSVDLLDELAIESGGAFAMSRRGYVYLSADPERAAELERAAERVAALGGGPLRRHDGGGAGDLGGGDHEAAGLDGADLITDPATIRRLLPAVTPDAIAMLHVRRAGWLDSRALGRWLLTRAQAAGVRLLRDEVTAVDTGGGRVRALRLAGGSTLETATLVLAPGPGLAAAGRLLGLELPVINEPHGKLTLDDRLGTVPRDSSLLIWNDPVRLDWSAEERRRLAADPATRPLLEALPAGVHCRPRGEREVLVLWSYGSGSVAADGDGSPSQDIVAAAGPPPAWSRFPRFHPLFSEVVLRGLARMLPPVSGYRGTAALSREVDGGWYCKTPDNRPLIGAFPIPGAWVLGALSGFGIMASQGAAEVLVESLTGGTAGAWAGAFRPGRFGDLEYLERLAGIEAGQGEL